MVEGGQIEKRHFWRRAFAFVLDVLLISIIAGFILLPISMALGVDLGASSFARTSTCDTAPPTLPVAQEIEREWPLAPGETRTNLICHVSMLGAGEYDFFHTQTASVAKSDTSALSYSFSSSRSLGVRIDKDGKMLAVAEYPDFSILLTVLIFAFFTANGRRTPGKAILSLRATTVDGGSLGWTTAIKRETLKLLPLLVALVFQIYQFVATSSGASDIRDLVAMVRSSGFSALLIVGPAFVLVWWLLPFIVWRGATWYDWIANTRVISTQKRKVA